MIRKYRAELLVALIVILLALRAALLLGEGWT
jgi:hypothetical protein